MLASGNRIVKLRSVSKKSSPQWRAVHGPKGFVGQRLERKRKRSEWSCTICGNSTCIRQDFRMLMCSLPTYVSTATYRLLTLRYFESKRSTRPLPVASSFIKHKVSQRLCRHAVCIFVLELLWLGMQLCREYDSKYLPREIPFEYLTLYIYHCH